MSKKNTIIKVILILLALLVIGLGIYAGRLYYIARYAPMSAFETEAAAQTQPPEPSPLAATQPPESSRAEVEDTPPPTETPMPTDESFVQQQRVNILMLGWDRSPERDDEDNPLYRDEDNNFRSDVMILLSINFASKEVDMISIPRDSYAEIYNTKGRWKINAAFAKGGGVDKDSFEYAQKTVSMLFGDIPINYYAGVDMEGLKAVVDAMGGVDYDVDVQIKLNGRVLEKGPQHLDGQQVLDYCRARKGISTDVGRVDRQQRMLFAIFEQLKTKDQLKNVPAIYGSVKDMIWTNLNIEQIASLAYFAMELDMENLNRHTLEGDYVKAYGISFYAINQKKKNDLCEEIFGVRPKYQAKYDLSTLRKDAAKERAAAEARAAEELAAQQAASASNASASDGNKPSDALPSASPSQAKLEKTQGSSPEEKPEAPQEEQAGKEKESEGPVIDEVPVVDEEE